MRLIKKLRSWREVAVVVIPGDVRRLNSWPSFRRWHRSRSRRDSGGREAARTHLELYRWHFAVHRKRLECRPWRNRKSGPLERFKGNENPGSDAKEVRQRMPAEETCAA